MSDPVEFLETGPVVPHGTEALVDVPRRRWWLIVLGAAVALVLAGATARSIGGGSSPKRSLASPSAVGASASPAAAPFPPSLAPQTVELPAGCPDCVAELSIPPAVLSVISPLFREAEFSQAYSLITPEGQLFERGLVVRADGGTLWFLIDPET